MSRALFSKLLGMVVKRDKRERDARREEKGLRSKKRGKRPRR